MLYNCNPYSADMKRVRPVKRRTLASILLNGVLAVLIFMAGLFVLWQGKALNGDTKVCRLDITVGQSTNEVVQRDGEHVILPFGVMLENLKIEEGNPPLALLDATTWRMKEEYRPEARTGAVEILGPYRVEIDTVIMYAVPVGDGFTYVRKQGAMPAAYVRVTRVADETQYQGWIYTGLAAISPQNLPLAGDDVLTLASPAVDRFTADISLHFTNGTQDTLHLVSLEPQRKKHYRFCLADFDREQGRWADNCLIEIERFPSLWLIVLGYVLLIAGIRGFVRMLRFLQERKVRRRMLGRQN